MSLERKMIILAFLSAVLVAIGIAYLIIADIMHSAMMLAVGFLCYFIALKIGKRVSELRGLFEEDEVVE